MEKSGVASGANSTARQLGAALGAADDGLAPHRADHQHAVDAVSAAASPPASPTRRSTASEAMGANWQPTADATPDQVGTQPTVRPGPHQRRALGPGVRRLSWSSPAR